jgi:TRAP-type mannitol/chloroaromatic compound transport system permease large subunit
MQKLIKHNSLLNRLILLVGFILVILGCFANGLIALTGAVLVAGALIAEMLNNQLAYQVIQSDLMQNERTAV